LHKIRNLADAGARAREGHGAFEDRFRDREQAFDGGVDDADGDRRPPRSG
jgi:hypothetical protein